MLTLRLNPTAVFGKAAGGDDFDLLWCSDGTLPSDVTAAAAAWLRVYLATRNRAVTALQYCGGRWWLLRAQKETGTDAVGRVRAFITLGALDELPSPQSLPGALVQLARAAVKKTEPPCTVDAPETKPEPTAGAAAAALALAIGEPFAVVGPLGQASAVLEHLPLTALNWAALLTDECPAWLPTGPGLVISGQAVPPPAAVQACVERHGPAAILGLPLADLPRHAGRLTLVRVALGETPAAGERAADVPDLEWLACTPPGRAAALAAIAPERVSDWLMSRKARPEDLDALSDRLRPEQRPAVRTLLRGLPDAVRRYVCLFADDTAGVIDLLTARNAETWQTLGEIGTPPPTAEAVADFLAATDGTPLPAAMGLPQWARAARSGCPAAEALFWNALQSAGVPADVAAVLRGESAARLIGPPPTLPATLGWLEGVNPAAWVRGRVAFTNPTWQDWWRAGVDIYLAAGRLRPIDLLDEALLARDPRLLERAGAPSTLVRLTDPNGGQVSLPSPEATWAPGAKALLTELFLDGTVFRRLQPPLTDAALAWLQERLSEGAVDELRRTLAHGIPAPPAPLCATGHLLSRSDLLRQVAAWGRQPSSADRNACLTHLLRGPLVTAEERTWLTALTLQCEPVPAAPPLSAFELADLLPLLDPVRDVVRVVMGWPKSEPGEKSLLERLTKVLSERPAPAPGAFPVLAWRVRPDWVAALASIPGWEASAADAQQIRGLVGELCRRLLDGPADGLSEATRQAAAFLAGGNESC